MTITKVGSMSLGAALPATNEARAAIDVLVAASLPEISSKISGYALLALPSASFNIGTQLGNAVSNLNADLTAVAAIPGTGTVLSAAISAGVAAMATLRTANPELGGRIDISVSAIGGLNAQINAGVTGPNVNVALIASILAQLESAKAAIEANASLSASIGSNLAAAGINVYRFDGDVTTAGTDLQGQINADGLSGQTHFVVLIPTTNVGWQAIQATVKTS